MKVFCESYDFATPHYALSVALRDKILRAPLGLTFKEEDLSKEWNDFHLGAFNEQGELCGCLVLQPIQSEKIKMRQVAVNTELQGQGIGGELVRFAERFASKKGYKEIILNARIPAVKFYQDLNYKIQGDEFEEVGIPHLKMSKKI